MAIGGVVEVSARRGQEKGAVKRAERSLNFYRGQAELRLYNPVELNLGLILFRRL